MEDEEHVTYYAVYLAESGARNARSKVGVEVPVGVNVQKLEAETALNSFTHVLGQARDSGQ